MALLWQCCKENSLRLPRVHGGWAALGQSTVIYIILHNIYNIHLLQRSTQFALYPRLLLRMELVRSLLNGLRGHFIIHCVSHVWDSLPLLQSSWFITLHSSLRHAAASVSITCLSRNPQKGNHKAVCSQSHSTRNEFTGTWRLFGKGRSWFSRNGYFQVAEKGETSHKVKWKSFGELYIRTVSTSKVTGRRKSHSREEFPLERVLWWRKIHKESKLACRRRKCIMCFSKFFPSIKVG